VLEKHHTNQLVFEYPRNLPEQWRLRKVARPPTLIACR